MAVDGVIQAGHQQAFGLGFGELVIRILPDVVHAAGWQGHQEAAIFAAADAGTHQIVELEGGIIDGRSGTHRTLARRVDVEGGSPDASALIDTYLLEPARRLGNLI